MWPFQRWASGSFTQRVSLVRTPSEERLIRSIEALRAEQAAQLIQRVQRGHAVRVQQERLAWATELSQRQWRTQRLSVAVLQVQLAARSMLEQRRVALEAGLNVEGSITAGGRWHHDRSAATLKSTLSHGHVALRVAPQCADGSSGDIAGNVAKGGSVGGGSAGGSNGRLASAMPNPLHAVAHAMVGMLERAESKHAYQESDAIADSGLSLVEHCGWLLKQGRAFQSWKIRWVMVQAGCLWYFKDDSRRDLLGRMHLTRATVDHTRPTVRCYAHAPRRTCVRGHAASRAVRSHALISAIAHAAAVRYSE